jgi:hypothetical protein
MAILDIAPGRLVERLGAALRLSEVELAQALDVNPRTLERWRAGTSYPQHEARERLSALEALAQRLTDTFVTPDAAGRWLHESSRYLGGLTPADALRVGRIDRVEAALEALDSGVFV